MKKETTKAVIQATFSKGVQLALLFVCLIISSAAVGQPKALDSLLAVYSATEDPQEKAVIGTDLADAYLKKNADSARYLAKISLKTPDITSTVYVKASLVLAKVANRQDSLQLARLYLHRAEPYVVLVEDDYWRLNYYLFRAYVSEIAEDYEDAVKHNLLGLEGAKQSADTAYLARFNNNLGITYYKLEAFEDALPFMRKGASYFEALGQYSFQYSAFLNMGAVFVQLEAWDSASYYLNKTYDYYEEQQNHFMLANILGNISDISFFKGDYQEAITLNHRKLNELEFDEGQLSLSKIVPQFNAFVQLGRAHAELSHPDSARYYLKNAIAIASQHNLLGLRVQATKYLLEEFQSQGLADSAIEYYPELIALTDSIQKEDNVAEAKKLKAEYEYKLAIAKEHEENNKLIAENKRLVLWQALITLGLLVVILIVYVAYLRIRKGKLERDIENRQLAESVRSKENKISTQQMQITESEQRIKTVVDILKQDHKSSDPEKLSTALRTIEGLYNKKALSELDEYIRNYDSKFFDALTTLHPNLTRTELRICIFIKFNLSTKEIAAITHKSENSIKVTRHRLHQKLALPKGVSLHKYLMSIKY